jgi:hypothetical protein
LRCMPPSARLLQAAARTRLGGRGPGGARAPAARFARAAAPQAREGPRPSRMAIVGHVRDDAASPTAHCTPQVDAFMFGSVPLKTYLPDGDIDLSIFCGPDTAAALKDTWALKLQDVLLVEQAKPDAPYVVGDVTVINAEVRPGWVSSGHGAQRRRVTTLLRRAAAARPSGRGGAAAPLQRARQQLGRNSSHC